MEAQRSMADRLMATGTPLQYQPSWDRMWQGLGCLQADPALLPHLLARYAEPHRKYHGIEHLDACLRQFELLRGVAERPCEVQLALWFHDAIYDLGRRDNEQRSADWAHTALLAAGAGMASAQRAHALVMVTCHDRPPLTLDQQVLLDVDLSILGQPRAVFEAYEQQIANEFASVPLVQRRVRRSAILQQFLDRPRIYHTDLFHQRCEAQARANLAWSIGQLAAAA